MGTKPQELLHVGKTSSARGTRDITIAVADQCTAIRKSSNLKPVLPTRLSDASKNERKASSARREVGTTIDLAAISLPMPSEESLRRLFDLTPAEARLAQRLACGDSVEEVAQILHIKMTTARTQLAAIFAKTDTRRQAKLVAILSRLAHLEGTAASVTPAPTAKTVENPPAGVARLAG